MWPDFPLFGSFHESKSFSFPSTLSKTSKNKARQLQNYISVLAWFTKTTNHINIQPSYIY